MKKGYFFVCIITLSVIVFAGCAHWTATEKTMFGVVCAAQLGDAIATQNHLNDHPGNYIVDEWAWKYGSDRPSDGVLWGVKAVELAIVYVVADMLPHDERKVFLGVVAGALSYYAISTAHD
jgi:hypothetical protein